MQILPARNSTSPITSPLYIVCDISPHHFSSWGSYNNYVHILTTYDDFSTNSCKCPPNHAFIITAVTTSTPLTTRTPDSTHRTKYLHPTSTCYIPATLCETNIYLLQRDIEEKRKVKNTLERDIEEKRKEKENLNREVLATRKEKDDLEQEIGLLKMDIRKILKEKSSLEEKTLTCRQPEKSMPFSTPSTLSEGSKLHPAFVTAYTPEEKVITSAVVEYTIRRVYMGALEEDKLTYCKTPLKINSELGRLANYKLDFLLNFSIRF
uniref:Uncharacterized protein n=1 Tax=Magallana gigas TaxID=29159 RepID=A0A8W8L6T2_MAGGI